MTEDGGPQLRTDNVVTPDSDPGRELSTDRRPIPAQFNQHPGDRLPRLPCPAHPARLAR